MYGYASLKKAAGEDLEAGTLYPGLSRGENELRWGFVRKVYGILAAQLLLTTVVSAATVLNASINELLTGSSGLALGLALLPLFWRATSLQTRWLLMWLTILLLAYGQLLVTIPK